MDLDFLNLLKLAWDNVYFLGVFALVFLLFHFFGLDDAGCGMGDFDDFGD